MAFNGWMSWGGTEIINVDRTEAYATKSGFTAFRPVYKNGNIAATVGDAPYTLPLFDSDVPWTDPNEPDSYDFYGVYPMDINGMEDSFRQSTAEEYTGDGGSPGRIRHGMRTIVFSTMLLAKDDGGMDYGMAWLRSALLAGQGSECVGDGYEGAQLCFFNQEPWGVDTAAEARACGEKLQRFFYRATVTNGPTVTAKKQTRNGLAWDVQWTVTVGNPWTFGAPVTLLNNWLGTGTNQVLTGAFANDTGYTWKNQLCPPRGYTPLVDPSAPDLVLPPAAPSVPMGNFVAPANWTRRWFVIPQTFIRTWTEMVPILSVKTKPGQVIKGLQFRLYADPDNSWNQNTNVCDFCADMVISYIPDNGIFTLDGRDETAVFRSAGQERRADGLVLNSRGLPMSWPSLTCGVRYIATVDLLQTGTKPTITLALAPKAR